MTKRNEIIVLLMAGLFVVLVWGLYITLIYMNSIPQSMEKETFCRMYIVAATQNCVPGVSANFGGLP